MSVSTRDVSHSTSSSSLYMTPMNSPITSPLTTSTTFADMSSLDSTTMDFTFSNTQTPDIEFRHIDNRCHLLSSASISSESTIKRSLSDDVLRNASTQSSKLCDANNSYENCNLLLKYLSELEGEHMELVAIERKLNSINLQCKMIREKSIVKTNTLYTIIEDMRNKCAIQTRDAQTQTSDVHSILHSSAANSDIVGIKPMFTNFRPILSKEVNLNKDLSPLMKHKLRRLPALIKGYLTRRLMKTEKVKNTLQTIYDTTQLLVNFKSDTHSREITNEDINLHKRLIIQLNNECSCYYDIFLSYSKKDQMAIIAQSRHNLLSRHFRNSSALSTASHTIVNADSISSGLSSVTRKKLKNKSLAKIDLNKTFSCEPKNDEYIKFPVKKVSVKSNKVDTTRRSKRFTEKRT